MKELQRSIYRKLKASPFLKNTNSYKEKAVIIKQFPIEYDFSDVLSQIDNEIGRAIPEEIPELFKPIPLDLFGRLTLGQTGYPNIERFLPTMPPDSIQKKFVGESGVPLLFKSIAIVRAFLSLYTKYGEIPIHNANVLDYGCGWGRLLRLFSKYVPFTNLFGVDPDEEILKICQETGVKGHLAKCDYIPSDIPFENRKFDLIYSFSVFTHLSEKTHKAVFDVMYKRLSENGILILTTRPKSFWNFKRNIPDRKRKKLIQEHNSKGFAFFPSGKPQINGEVTYGGTSISPEYMQKNWTKWEIIESDWNHENPYQILHVLKKRS